MIPSELVRRRHTGQILRHWQYDLNGGIHAGDFGCAIIARGHRRRQAWTATRILALKWSNRNPTPPTLACNDIDRSKGHKLEGLKYLMRGELELERNGRVNRQCREQD